MKLTVENLLGLLLVLFLVASLGQWAAGAFDSRDPLQQISVERDRQKGEVLVKTLPVSEVLGPLAPVALSPFFGLACLSGTSILCSQGVLPENSFLMGSAVLNNPAVFLAFLVLTVITSVPKLTAASKVFAELTDQLETYAGIVSYGVILLLASESRQPESEAVVYAAGVFTFTQQTLLVCVAAVNILVISTVRLFFELLVLISPIPLLDAIFEGANKTVTALLALIYAYNPWVAFVINLLLFGFCLLIFRWVNRRIKYLRAVLLDPVMTGLKKKWLKDPSIAPDARAKRKLVRQGRQVDLLIKCFPKRKLGKIKKKDLCYLVFAGTDLVLIKPSLFGAPRVEPLDKKQVGATISAGLLTYSLALTEKCEVAFGRAYTSTREEIKTKLARMARA